MAANYGDDDTVGVYGGDIEAQLEQMRVNTIETLRKIYAMDSGDATAQDQAGTQKQTQLLTNTAPDQVPESIFIGDNGRGLTNDAARLLAGRQNRINTDDSVAYTAEEHGDPSLPNEWAMVGRKVASQNDTGSTDSDSGAAILASDSSKNDAPPAASQLSLGRSGVRQAGVIVKPDGTRVMVLDGTRANGNVQRQKSTDPAPKLAPNANRFDAEEVDRQIINGNYDAFKSIRDALADGRIGDAWQYASHTPSQQARDAAYDRVYPAQSEGAVRLDRMLASPFGAGLAGAANLVGASQKTQDNLLATGQLLEGLGSAVLAPKTVSATRAIPQGMTSEQFDKFSSALRKIIQSENLPPGTTVVQGSRAYGSANPGVSDIDVMHIVDKADFDEFAANRLPQLRGSNLDTAVNQVTNQQRLGARAISHTIESNIWDNLWANTVPTLDMPKVQFSMCTAASPFINGPLIPIRENKP